MDGHILSMPPTCRSYCCHFAHLWALVTYKLREERRRFWQLVEKRTRELQQAYRNSQQHIKYSGINCLQCSRTKSSMPSPQKLQKAPSYHLPHSQMNGNFYWVYRWKNKGRDKTLLIVGNCIGDGVPEALLIVSMLRLLNSAVHQHHITQHDRILLYLQKEFIRHLAGEQTQLHEGTEALIVLMDCQGSRLLYSESDIPPYL